MTAFLNGVRKSTPLQLYDVVSWQSKRTCSGKSRSTTYSRSSSICSRSCDSNTSSYNSGSRSDTSEIRRSGSLCRSTEKNSSTTGCNGRHTLRRANNHHNILTGSISTNVQRCPPWSSNRGILPCGYGARKLKPFFPRVLYTISVTEYEEKLSYPMQRGLGHVCSISRPNSSTASISVAGSLNSNNASDDTSNLSQRSTFKSKWSCIDKFGGSSSGHYYSGSSRVCAGSSSITIAKRWKRYIPFQSSRVPKTRQPPPPPPPLFSASSSSVSAVAGGVQPSLQLAIAAAAEDVAEDEAAAAAEAALQLSPWQAVRVLQAFLPPPLQYVSSAVVTAIAAPVGGGATETLAATTPLRAANKGPATAAIEDEAKTAREEYFQYATYDYFEQQQQQAPQRDGEADRSLKALAATAAGRKVGQEVAGKDEESATAADSASSSSSSSSAGIATVTLTLNVAADLKRESVRGVCTLAHGVGSNVRLAVFCPDEEAPAMLALGADYAGVEALLPRIAKGWVGFDKALAVASVMPQLLKVARVLGPRKLMPSPKSGTVVTNLKEAVRAVKSGEAVEFRAEGENAEIKVVIGRTTFSAAQLLENIKCVVKDILKARPRSTGTDQEEAAQTLAQAFVWPPPSFIERRQKLLTAKNLRPAIPELLSASSRKRQRSSAESFILAAHLSAAGTPSIPVHPVLLAPSSVGYYR